MLLQGKRGTGGRVRGDCFGSRVVADEGAEEA